MNPLRGSDEVFCDSFDTDLDQRKVEVLPVPDERPVSSLQPALRVVNLDDVSFSTIQRMWSRVENARQDSDPAFFMELQSFTKNAE